MHATTSQKAINLQPAILALLAAFLFIAGIALGSVMELGTTSTATAVAVPDTSYNAVEGARAQFGVAADTSYNAVESIRAQSGVTVDTSLVGKSGYPSSRGSRTQSSATSHDLARATGGWWASAPIVTDPEPVPGDRPGPGYR
jgi:hypothetical protein